MAEKSGLHELESGLIHTADSSSGGVRGTFVQHYGEPGNPETHATAARDRGILGKQPKLSTRFLAREGR